MGGFNCRKVPVNAFNRMAEPQGISVESRDAWVDGRDRFERKDADGAYGITFRSDDVQSVMRLWRADCESLKRRASSAQMRELAKSYSVKFGPPALPAAGDAERLGVYRGAKHLFDVDASQGSGDGGPGIAAQFAVRHLAHLLAEGLHVDLHPRYRARVSISRADRAAIDGMGVQINEARERILGPNGEVLRYGGSLAEGYTRVAIVEAVSDTSIEVVMHRDDGGHRKAIFPLRAREATAESVPPPGAIDEDPYGDSLAGPEGEIRPPDERGGRKRTIIGPGISITVYE